MSEDAFVIESHAQRVIFGDGSLTQLASQLDDLACSRALLVYSPSQRAVAEQAREALGTRLCGVIDEVRQHVPAAVAERARERALVLHADAVVTIGGGSAIGLGKAIAVAAPTILVAVPTTYSGSEATPVWGISSDGAKKTGSSLRALPRVVLYDPSLTTKLPPHVTGSSAMNALAHAVEALWGPRANPVGDALALRGVRTLSAALPAVLEQPSDLPARTALLRGAYLAGAAFASAGGGLAHTLVHALGGGWNVSHADAHGVILPHVAALNLPALRDVEDELARELSTDDVAAALRDLATAAGVPNSLAQLGVPEQALSEVARRVAAKKIPNPIPATESVIRELIDSAWRGVRPPVERLATGALN